MYPRRPTPQQLGQAAQIQTFFLPSLAMAGLALHLTDRQHVGFGHAEFRNGSAKAARLVDPCADRVNLWLWPFLTSHRHFGQRKAALGQVHLAFRGR